MSEESKETKPETTAEDKGKETKPEKKPKKEKPAPSGIAKPGRDFFNGTTIHLNCEGNPRKEGSVAANSFKLIIENDGLTFEEFMTAGGRLNQVRLDSRRGYLVIKREGKDVAIPEFDIPGTRRPLTDEEKAERDEKKKADAEARKKKREDEKAAKKAEREKAKKENPPGEGKEADSGEKLGDGKSGTIEDGKPDGESETSSKKK